MRSAGSSLPMHPGALARGGLEVPSSIDDYGAVLEVLTGEGGCVTCLVVVLNGTALSVTCEASRQFGPRHQAAGMTPTALILVS